MPMPPYRIMCHQKDCPNQAVYKIAALWSDGVARDLKTYGLVCEECLSQSYRESLVRQASCRRAARETLELPGIYRLQRGARDVELERLKELEGKLAR